MKRLYNYHRQKFLQLLLTSLTLLLPQLMYAQQKGLIAGYIKDSDGAIANATVKLMKSTTGSKTDERGYFEIGGINPGTYTLLITSVGYSNREIKVTVKPGKNAIGELMLETTSQELKNMQIMGKTKTQESRESAFAVQSIETRQLANTTTDLNQVLNRSTGIRVREQGGLGSDFQFSINGLSGKSVRFFMDGIPMESFGSSMSLNNLPVNLAERIEVYKGVVPV